MVKKLNPLFVQQKLSENNIKIFTPREFRRIFDVSFFAASKFIYQQTQKKIFIKLRNGLYCLSLTRPDLFAIANKIYQPSYISLETALAFHNIIPEKVYTITSVSAKATRSFSAINQEFSYSKIKKDLFVGYNIIERGSEKFLIAEPEKALLDYLYISNKNRSKVNERIDISLLKKDRIKKWQKIFNSSAVNKLISKLYDDRRTN